MPTTMTNNANTLPNNALRRHPVLSGIGIVILLLVVVLGICEWAGWPFLRGPLQDQLTKRLDRDVSVGDKFSLHLLGPVHVKTDSFAVGPPRWAPQTGDDAKFFSARDVDLKLPWSTIWDQAFSKDAQPLHIADLEVGSFDASLWRHADGRANWEFPSSKPKDPNKPTTLPEFDKLVIRNGVLALVDDPSTLKMHAQASTEETGGGGAGASAGASSGTTVGTSAPASGASGATGTSTAAADTGGLHITGDGHYREGNFNFAMHSNGVLPLIAPDGENVTVPVSLSAKAPNGHFKFDGQARDIVHMRDLSGTFDIGGTSLAKVGAPFGITLPTTAEFNANGKLSKDGDVYKATFARFDVGSSNLSGDFTFDKRQKVPVLTGTLRGRNLDLVDLGPAFGTPAPGADNPDKPSGKVFPAKEFDIPSLKAMNAAVSVDLQRLDLHTAILKPFTPAQAQIKLQDGVLTIDKLLAHTSGGEIQGHLGLDGRNTAQPKWDGDLRIAGVELQDWVKMPDSHIKGKITEPTSGKQVAPSYLTGRLGGHITFTGTGKSVAAMAGSLDGTIGAWVNDGTISHVALEAAGLDVAQAIGVLVKGDNALPMQCAVTQFTAKNGVMHTDVGIIDSTDTTMIINGDLSLAQEQLALVVQADPKDFSPASLRSPLHIDGPFDKPKIKLEAKPIGIKAGLSVAMGALLTPLAAIIPLIDPGKKAPYGCQTALEQLRGTRGQGLEAPKVQATDTTAALPAKAARGKTSHP